MHSAPYEDGRWRLWYAVGDDREFIVGQPYPRYHIRYAQTDDLRRIPRDDAVCLRSRDDEDRMGRPSAYQLGDPYLMYCTG